MGRRLKLSMIAAAAVLGVLAVFLYVATTRIDAADTTSPPAPAPTKPLPADVLDLANWKLTLPEPEGDPREDDGDDDDDDDDDGQGAADVSQPTLGTYAHPEYFFANATGDGVVFRAPVDGATTSGSGYPRSELREMTDGGSESADWSSEHGVHTMTITQAITHTPEVKPEVVAGQIHDDDDDVVMIRLEKDKLIVEADGDEVGVLDRDYKLGTKFTVVINASPDGIRVTYNGKTSVNYDKTGEHWYFKAGCYTQAKAGPGKDDDEDDDKKYDKPGAYGEVVIYSLKVDHTN